MSQAEALLAGVTVDDVVMFSSQYVEVEPHIAIGIDRFITVPDELKRLAVQYDHNMRTVTFDCPRYYDGRDMASMKIYINYINLNDKKVKGSHIAENVVIDNFDGNIIHFDWTIKKHVTPSKGNLAFLVCVRQVDTEGNESNHWNSELNTECYISEGMEFDSETIENEYPDIVTQLLERMDSVEALATPEAMQGYANAWLEENSDEILAGLQAKGEEVLATIPADYTETSKLAAEASANSRTKADAITRTVEGSAIAVSDSSDDHLRGLRIFGKTEQFTTTGKNLLPYPYPGTTQNVNGATVTVNDDGSVTFNGTPTDYIGIALINSAPIWSGEITIALLGTFTNVIGEIHIVDSNGDTLVGEKVNPTYTVNLDDYADITKLTLVIKRASNNVAISGTVYPMVVSGNSVPTAYEIYTGSAPAPNLDYPQELVSVEYPTVDVFGKNLLNPEDLYTNPHYTDLYSSALLALKYRVEKGKTYTLSFDTENTGKLMYVNPNSGFAYVQFTMDGQRKSFTKTMDKSIDSTTQLAMVSVCETTDVACGTISDVQLTLFDRDGVYEPYKAQENLTLSAILRGIPVSQNGNHTDINGQQWLCDEIDFERGVLIRRVYQDTVGFTAETDTNGIRYRAFLTYHTDPTYNGLVLCDKLSYAAHANPGTNGIRISTYSTNLAIAYYNGEVIDSATILYPLATPIETPLSDEELAWYKAAYTNYHHTTVLNDADAEMEMRYNADTEIWINNLIKATSPIKSTTVTLSSSKWVDTTYGYSQVVTMNGITANSKVDLQPSPDQLADLTTNGISLTTSNDNGVVTVHAIGSHPSSDMTMQVQITEVIPV